MAVSGIVLAAWLTESGFPYPHRHVAFEFMSHGMLTKLPRIYRMAFKSERRHPKECERDRETLKKELMNWAENVW